MSDSQGTVNLKCTVLHATETSDTTHYDHSWYSEKIIM